MSPPPVSVVVVSRGRPWHLGRCLQALRRLYYPRFEIVVVADPAGRAAAAATGVAIKEVAYDTANISAARNLGIARAAGEIVAFIDDDAVAEPTWLDHMAAAFTAMDVAAVGGTVLGRNGISVQWGPRRVEATGRHHPLPLSGDAPCLCPHPPGGAVRTEGTNMAVRRAVLAALGGFDEGFRFYNDDTDLNLRLAALGHATAFAPLAQVHHGFAASARRREDRTPRDLHEIGASVALLARKHAPDRLDEALARSREEQRRRLLAMMVDGRCLPGDIGRLLRTLEAGFAEGQDRPLATPAPIGPPSTPFRPCRPHPAPEPLILAGRTFRARALRAEAARRAAPDRTVSLYLFGPTLRPHRVRFDPAGFWEQSGGLFGRSVRSGPALVVTGFHHRVRNEAERVAPVRQTAMIASHFAAFRPGAAEVQES